MRALIVYGYEPSGHASAARALEASFLSQGIEVSRVNVSSDVHPVLGPALAGVYFKVIQKCPALWAALYDNNSLTGIAQDWRKLYLLFEGEKLSSRLQEIAPDFIVCTQAPPLAALALQKRQGGLFCPLIAAITDYEVHSYWIGPQADLYLVASQEAAKTLSKRGIAADKIRDFGIPIHPTFERPIKLSEARERLQISSQRVLLVSGGSRGFGAIPDIIEALMERMPQAQVLAICGSNEELFQILKKRYEGDKRVRSFASLDSQRVKELMCASDILIGKAGGLTAAESLAAGLPMAILDPIPGQEEKNTQYLLKNGAAIAAKTPQEIAEAVLTVFSSGLDLMKRRALALGRPDSARRGVEEILRLTWKEKS